jgi:hypothetical protein
MFFALHNNEIISSPPLTPISKRSCDPHYELLSIWHANNIFDLNLRETKSVRGGWASCNNQLYYENKTYY